MTRPSQAFHSPIAEDQVYWVVEIRHASGTIPEQKVIRGDGYRCQHESGDNRSARRAEVIRRRLGWKPGILNGHGPKPLGMHWRTFERHEAAHDKYANAALVRAAARLGLAADAPPPTGEAQGSARRARATWVDAT